MSNSMKAEIRVTSSASSKAQLDARAKQKNWQRVCQKLAEGVFELRSQEGVATEELEAAEKELWSACGHYGASVKFPRKEA